MATITKQEVDSYLTFKLGKEEYAANVTTVLNILELTKITHVPKAPEYMKGIINLRGEVLPVIDTRIKFGMDETRFTDNTCILVLEIDMDEEPVKVGAIVDSVQEVLEIGKNQLQAAPSIGKSYKSDFIAGMFLSKEEFIMILDMERVFSVSELNELKSSVTSIDTENLN